MKNFSARGVNAMAPGKRMRTTISPTILARDGRAFATLGTPGAARIISTMTLLVSNLVDYGMGIQEAIEAPRFYARDTDKDLYVESRVPADTLAGADEARVLDSDAGRVRPVLRRRAGDRHRSEDREAGGRSRSATGRGGGRILTTGRGWDWGRLGGQGIGIGDRGEGEMTRDRQVLVCAAGAVAAGGSRW